VDITNILHFQYVNVIVATIATLESRSVHIHDNCFKSWSLFPAHKHIAGSMIDLMVGGSVSAVSS
jgi:hypothetical protein